MKRPLRRASNGLAVVSLAACTAMAVFWVESYRRILKLSFPKGAFETAQGQDYPGGRGRQFGIDSYVGTVHLVASKCRALPNCNSGDYGTVGDIGPNHYELPVQAWEAAGFAWFDGYFDASVINSDDSLWRYRSLVVPYWFLTLAAVCPAGICVVSKIRTAKVRKRLLNGLCPACGYDLTGNASGVCPECGTAFKSKGAP